MFIICFSLDNRTSFDNVRTKWVPEIRHHCPEVPAVLVGTKLDIRQENEEGKEEEETIEPVKKRKKSFVTTSQGAALATEINAVK